MTELDLTRKERERIGHLLRQEAQACEEDDLPHEAAANAALSVRVDLWHDALGNPIKVPGDAFEALRAWRTDVARQKQLPPYIIATDGMLRNIVVANPKTMADFGNVPGMGPAKTGVYGAAILAVLREAA